MVDLKEAARTTILLVNRLLHDTYQFVIVSINANLSFNN